jgi:two-component system response regulator HydG
MINIRNANESDTNTILQFIKELAEYEKMSKDVTATEELLKENLFVKIHLYVRTKIVSALQKCSGNKSKAAAMLGIDRKTLYNKLKLYQIE